MQNCSWMRNDPNDPNRHEGCAGFRRNPGLALDIIHEVGPGGSYIAHEHTYQHMREQSGTKLFDRRSREDWLTVTKGKSIQEKAYAAAIDILKNHRPAPLPKGAFENMEKIVTDLKKKSLQTTTPGQFDLPRQTRANRF